MMLEVIPSRPRAGWLVALSLCAAGCSMFQPSAPPPPPPAAPVAPPTPVVLKPTATHRFELTPEDGDLVGYVQKVTVGKDDTMPDIARRFDVGYEEILLANPGVDPWLPGPGREVIVPTQFVLPAAPHEGVVVNVAAMRIFYYPPHKKGEPQVVIHAPASASAVWVGRPRKARLGSSPVRKTRVGGAGVGAQGACRGRRHAAGRGESGARHPLGEYAFRWLAELPDPRHQQALRGGHALEPRLHAPVPRGHRGLLRADPYRHQGHVVNQPYVFGWRDGTLYMQAYAVMEDDSRNWDKIASACSPIS